MRTPFKRGRHAANALDRLIAPVKNGTRATQTAKPMPPRKASETPADLLEHEFAQERASALGRLGRALEAELATLAQFDAEHAGDANAPADHRQARAELVARSSVALWQFIVQREACGLRDMRLVLRDYHVPPEVAARMGMLPAQPEATRRPKRRS